ncbi:MAG: Asp-tRNA(Asn)/Glu-tRNA(Gln) amidotransferase subunit GatB [Spirochaetaceae bacterium]|nr:Asp-tRNA(Asn)/Glu-tRNA(Gln) amidotransferase subunit GatB [Spirochaetaceae bacterium]
MGNYQSFIGLEVHIHLLTKTKVFCGCPSSFGGEPNTHVCPVCMGYPGVLPSLNREAMRLGCMVARALDCTIPEATWFERKQYFYPDMTKNYQISQFASPLGQQGRLDVEGRSGERMIKKRVRIKECHLEEDAGKMIHTGTVSLLDYNRAGMALLEIVTEPDMETGEEAELFIRQLRRLVRYLGASDGSMEEGSLRADANVSINTPGAGLGKKVEIKNLNSSRFVRLGLNYEIARQGELLDAGKTVTQETRLWNENRDQTEPMRQKENAQDYRYFPEPDLPVFVPDAAFRNRVEASLVELPLVRIARFQETYGLAAEHAEILCEEKGEADYFEAAVAEAVRLGAAREDAAPRTAKLLLSEIRRLMAKGAYAALTAEAPPDRFPVTPGRLAVIVSLAARGKLTGKNAKQCLEAIIAENREPLDIIAERGWEQITDLETIGKAARAVYAAETDAFRAVREAGAEGQSGEKRRRTLTAFLTGKVLAATGGRADPEIAARKIEELIAGV